MSAKRAVIYTRVSTERQGESGLGLEAQTTACRAYAEAHGWVIAGEFVDVASGKSTDRRPQLGIALDRLDVGWADILVVAKLDRLSRSLVDFSKMILRGKTEGWSIVALDIGIDTENVNGRLVANVIMALAEWERERIGERIRDALAVTKSHGTRLGRPTTVTDEVLTSIVTMRAEGLSFQGIADNLNTARVPTPQGAGQWRKSTIHHLYERALGSEDTGGSDV